MKSKRIVVTYLGLTKPLVGKLNETLLLDNDELLGLLRELFKKHGSEFKNAVFDESSSSVKPNILISVNGKVVRDLAEKLKDGDAVVISTVTVGG